LFSLCSFYFGEKNFVANFKTFVLSFLQFKFLVANDARFISNNENGAHFFLKRRVMLKDSFGKKLQFIFEENEMIQVIIEVSSVKKQSDKPRKSKNRRMKLCQKREAALKATPIA